MDMYGFYTGKSFDAYKFLGCHKEGAEWVFRTFAPAAVKVSLIGEFNGWADTPMERVYDGNFWECRLPAEKAVPGLRYKFRIYQRDGRVLDHCDPYGFGMEVRPHSASVIRDMEAYRFGDEAWMKKRTDCKGGPLNIYEIHAGSWRKEGGGEAAEGAKEEGSGDGGGWYTYLELAERLVPYLQENGYNYVELLPLSEHPSDESWGYQCTGFYSPTSRYGTCDDLKGFIDACHQGGIGVILDFVPVHFAVDDYGLADYDGTALYEYPHTDVGDSEWGSKNFNHSRGEVRSFLQSAAHYWMEEYHFDGLRLDAISNMVYWQGDKRRGVNQNAVEFIRCMNGGLKERHRGILLAAEDSTSFPGVTKPVGEGGLGFDYKWDMGFMHDTLEYFQEAPEWHVRDYHKLTFSMQYFYSENFLLPFSHDEVVHGKATVLQKMYGDYDGKFPQGRVLYLYMYTHPGKKLNFMGSEFGQLREWDEKREQDWGLLKYPIHDGFARFMRELNQIYLKRRELWALDFAVEGFCWVDCHQEQRCLYAFTRTDGKGTLLAAFNFSDKDQDEWELELDGFKDAELLINTDWQRYGGQTPEDTGSRAAGGQAFERSLPALEDGKLVLALPAMSGRLYRLD